MLPLWLLCCTCHCRPLPSRHPSPPLLVDCCIFHVHCRIAVHPRRSVAPTIVVDAVAVVLPSRCPCPLLLSLVDCCLPSAAIAIIVPTIAATSVALSRLPSPSSLLPSHLCCAFNRLRRCTFHRHCYCVAIALSIASIESISPLAAIRMVLSAAYLVVILQLRRRRRAVCRPGMDMPLRSLRRRSCCT